MAVQHCVHEGVIGGTSSTIIALESWERDWGAVGVRVSCRCLSCETCRTSVAADGLAKSTARRFRCACGAVEINGWTGLASPSVELPGRWRCAGHVPPRPGESLWGHPVPRDAASWLALVTRLVRAPSPTSGPLAGFVGFGLAHLLVSATDVPTQRALARVVGARLLVSDVPAERRAALDLYWLAPRFPGFERLAELLAMPAIARDVLALPGAIEPDEARWLRRVALAQLADGFVPALVGALRDDLAAGTLVPEVLAYFVAVDPWWVIQVAPSLCAHGPGWEPALRAAFDAATPQSAKALAEALAARA